MPSSQLTLRNVDPELASRLRALSEENGESVNATVLRLLRDALGSNERRERLRRYITWTEEDRRDFEADLRAQRQIDAQDWG